MTAPLILVVDDDPANRLLLQQTLAADGYEVCTAASAPEAEAQLAQRRPALIICDLLMWPVSGLDLIRSIRAQDAYAGIPILACSAHADIKLQEAVMLSGGQGYLVKPAPTLLRDVRAWLPRVPP